MYCIQDITIERKYKKCNIFKIIFLWCFWMHKWFHIMVWEYSLYLRTNSNITALVLYIQSSIDNASFVGCDQNLMLSAFIKKITKLSGCLAEFKGIMWFAASGCLDYNLEAIKTIWWLSYFNDFFKELH